MNLATLSVQWMCINLATRVAVSPRRLLKQSLVSISASLLFSQSHLLEQRRQPAEWLRCLEVLPEEHINISPVP